MPRHSKKPAPRNSHPQSRSHGPDPETQSSLPDSILTDPTLIHLDGRTLEGGGQLVRLALTLSALTSTPLHIHHIRGGRSANSSGRGGGLKSSHLAALNFLAEATAAKTHGAFVGSSEILFEPGRDRQALKARGGADSNPIFTQSTPYEIKLSSPGSVWLILQCILPYILFASPYPFPSPSPIRLTLHGGTNVPKSMSGEWVAQVLLQTLKSIGLPEPTLEIEKRGWSSGKTPSIGIVHISIPPLPPSTVLPPFTSFLATRGPITHIAITVLADPPELRDALIAHTRSALQNHPDLPKPSIHTNEPSGDPRRIYLLLVAHCATGHRLGRDALFEGKLKVPLSEAQIEAVAERMGRGVVRDLVREIGGGGGGDEFLRDQVVVFEALAGRKGNGEGGRKGEGKEGKGKGVEEVGREESLHTKTCRWVVEQVLRREGGVEGVTEGIGFVAGEKYQDREKADDVASQLKGLEVEEV